MLTEPHFIREILADPESPTPRLVFADWLEERGGPRAEALRVGAELRVRQRARMEINVVKPPLRLLLRIVMRKNAGDFASQV